jgi:predicted exporter
VEFGGQFESAAEASRVLLLLGSAVVVGIFLLLFVAFRSARDAFLVMLNLPLSIIGGVLGVYAAGGVVTIASIIGFITLFGIATRNGVMMIAHIHHLVAHDEVRDIDEAVKRGAEERLVPILMTALAAGLALVPLALSAGQPGSEIQAPMAVVILFGLLSSTVLNMLVVPALYRRFGAARQALEAVNDVPDHNSTTPPKEGPIMRRTIAATAALIALLAGCTSTGTIQSKSGDPISGTLTRRPLEPHQVEVTLNDKLYRGEWRTTSPSLEQRAETPLPHRLHIGRVETTLRAVDGATLACSWQTDSGRGEGTCTQGGRDYPVTLK